MRRTLRGALNGQQSLAVKGHDDKFLTGFHISRTSKALMGLGMKHFEVVYGTI